MNLPENVLGLWRYPGQAPRREAVPSSPEGLARILGGRPEVYPLAPGHRACAFRAHEGGPEVVARITYTEGREGWTLDNLTVADLAVLEALG